MSKKRVLILISVIMPVIAMLALTGCSSNSNGAVGNSPGIITTSLPDGVVGKSYSQVLQASGGTVPYRWSVSSGQLPDGLVLAADTGTISGTPAVAGGTSFTVQVTDSRDSAAVQTLYVNIQAPANPVPTTTATTNTQAPLAIVTSELPESVLGADYSQSLEASGGSGTYHWALADGSLPDGLSLDTDTGLISGKPAKAGTFDFTVIMSDGANAVYQQLSITINGMSGVSDANLLGIWGSSMNGVFAVGAAGTILFYDGKNWTSMDSGTTETLHAVWGSSGSDVYAVGNSGTVLHYDGSAWQPVNVTGTYDLYNIWGSSAHDIFISGSSGTVLHFDGNKWNTDSGTATENLFGIWGLSADNVIAVGDSQDAYFNEVGAIFQYNGKNWNAMTSGTSASLLGVWGSSANNIFTAGTSGTILHFDGNGWSPVNSDATDSLHCVWGISGSSVFAAGDNGTLLYFNGSNWSPMVSNTTEDLHGIWGEPEDGFFAVGDNGFILHYDIPGH